MPRLEFETRIAAPPEVCFDLSLDVDAHMASTFPSRERAIAGVTSGVMRLGDEVTLARPLAVEDLVRVMSAALTHGRLRRKTVAITGPEELPLSEVIRRVGDVVGKHPPLIRLPTAIHYVMARIFEWTMVIPLVATAQVRILTEGMTEAAPFAGVLPEDLQPHLALTPEQIHKGLPDPRPFGIRDLRCCQATHPPTSGSSPA
jgi:hypothetical protein